MEEITKVCSNCETKYTIQWDEEVQDLEPLTCPFCGYETDYEDDAADRHDHADWN